MCRRLAGNDADALDATQEALLAIVRGLERFDGRSAFGTWAYRVATNACLDELRRRSRRPVPGADDSESLDIAGNRRRSDHSEAVAAKVDVDRGLAQLREEFRVPVVLRDVAGLDYAEIAKVLDVPPGTVRSRIARGRAQLAEAIGGTARATARRTAGGAESETAGGNQPAPETRPKST